MPESLPIRYTSSAVNDLDLIFGYISVENKAAAYELVSDMEAAVMGLSEMPYMGSVVNPEVRTNISGLRYVVVAPYVIFYVLQQDEVVIARVLHSRQDWLHLLFIGF